MDFSINRNYLLAYFPFLPESKEFIAKKYTSIEDVLKSSHGEVIRKKTLARMTNALLNHEMIPHLEKNDSVSVNEELVSYVLSRVISVCINNRDITNRLIRYESERAYNYLVNESNQENSEFEGNYSKLSLHIAHQIGIEIENNKIPLVNYIECTAPLHDPRWKLINRKVSNGFVTISDLRRPGEDSDELIQLIRERIRVVLKRDLPQKAAPNICALFPLEIERITALYQEISLQQFGEIKEGAFPPCIQDLISSLTAGKNLTHAARFSLTAFLHNIGMNVNEISELYARSPDFDILRTMYQVEHITGREGTSTEYNTPACAAMKTNNLCVGRDKLCMTLTHPLSYYRKKSKMLNSDIQKSPKTQNPGIPQSKST